MAKKSITEKVMDIFVGAVARDLSKTAIKKAKEAFAEKSENKRRLRRNPDEGNQPTNPNLEP